MSLSLRAHAAALPPVRLPLNSISGWFRRVSWRRYDRQATVRWNTPPLRAHAVAAPLVSPALHPTYDMVPLEAPEAMRLPSAEIATVLTQSVCPLNSTRQFKSEV
jgi:hypothetical protein